MGENRKAYLAVAAAKIIISRRISKSVPVCQLLRAGIFFLIVSVLVISRDV